MAIEAKSLSYKGQNIAPAVPSIGSYKTYFKDDGKMYYQDSTGLETAVGSGSGSDINILKSGETLQIYVGYLIEVVGTVSILDTAVTGTDTLFLTDFVVGDFIISTSDVVEILSIESDTALTLTRTHETYTGTIQKSVVGNDTNDGTIADETHALATISAALGHLPDIINGIVEIHIAPGKYLTENVSMFYVVGGGELSFYDLSGTASYPCIKVASIYFYNCRLGYLYLNNIEAINSFLISECGANDIYLCKSDNGFTVVDSTAYIMNSYAKGDPAIYARHNAYVRLNEVTTTGCTAQFRAESGSMISIDEGNIIEDIPGIIGNGGKIEPLKPTGITADRPIGIAPGYQYFDTTLTKPIWYTGTNWVDSTGTVV